MNMHELMFKIMRRPPDFVIGDDKALDNSGDPVPYILRWWVIPRNKFFNIYVHLFLRDDDDRALHDHPWVNMSVVLTEGYEEIVPATDTEKDKIEQNTRSLLRKAGQIILRKPTAAHRIKLLRDADGNMKPAWTLFVTGPRIRQWGFWCPKGFKHWEKYTKKDKPGEVGPGCND